MIKQFHHSDFLPIKGICDKKQESGTTISLIIPAYNEASTISDIISKTKRELMDKNPLLDEIVVMDGDSDDDTALRAHESGAVVHRVSEIGDKNIPQGKGTALWKSFLVTKGDIVVCIDADIKNFDIRFVYGLIAPLLLDSTLSFVKGYYKRPLIVDDVTIDNHGGRVTEILARPLLSTFYPDLARLIQPLAGEYSFRRNVCKHMSFFSGYGVEIGLIIDIYRTLGLSSFAQVDMDIRYHRNRSVTDLGKMAFGILQVILRKLEEDKKLSFSVPLNTSLISYGIQGREETIINQMELPPII